jgi:hypothetical protein
MRGSCRRRRWRCPRPRSATAPRRSYECLPPSKHQVPENQLDGLRCGSWITEPGGLKEGVIHIWKHAGNVVARVKPEQRMCEGDGVGVPRTLDPQKLAAIGDPAAPGPASPRPRAASSSASASSASSIR